MKKLLSFLLIGLYATCCNATVIDGWDIQVSGDIQRTSHLVLEEEFETYTGDLALNKIEKKANNGISWVLVPVTVKRVEETDHKLESTAFTLTVQDKVYSREKEDAFLVDFKMRPLTKLKINKGTHNGFLMFSLPDKVMIQDAVLSYQGKEVDILHP